MAGFTNSLKYLTTKIIPGDDKISAIKIPSFLIPYVKKQNRVKINTNKYFEFLFFKNNKRLMWAAAAPAANRLAPV